MSRRLLGVLMVLAGVAVALGLGVRWFRQRNAESPGEDPTARGVDDRPTPLDVMAGPAHPSRSLGSSTATAGWDAVDPRAPRPMDTVEPPLAGWSFDAATLRAHDIDAGLSTTANPDLPVSPSREDLVAAFAAIAPAVARCSDMHTRVVPVTVVISGDGTVSRAAPTANYPSGGVAECVARATRALRVRPFRSSQMTVVYPFLFD